MTCPNACASKSTLFDRRLLRDDEKEKRKSLKVLNEFLLVLGTCIYA
jgi:hypothetical protein